MKSTVSYSQSIYHTYPHEVLKAVMESGLQNFSSDSHGYMLKYNGKWMSYDNVRKLPRFSYLPALEPQ